MLMIKSYKIGKELPPKKGELLITQKKAVEVTTLDATAMKIISKSTFTTHHKHGPHRGVRASNIINDFFNIEHFQGKTLLELGPAHYSFALLARHLGAKVICVERDPIFAELGRHLGLEIIKSDIFKIGLKDIGTPVDGLWMKNVQYRGQYEENSLTEFACNFTNLLTPQAWGLCVIRNAFKDELPKDHQSYVNTMLERQKLAFEKCGWKAVPIEEADRKRYALKFAGANWIFTYNL